MKIGAKINLIFISVFSGVAVVIILIVGLYINNFYKNQIYSYLFSSGRARAEHVRTFLNEKKITTLTMAASAVFRDLLLEPKDSSQYDAIREKVYQRLQRSLEVDDDLIEMFLLDKNGVIDISTDKSQESIDKSKDPYFTEGVKGVFIKDIYYSEFVEKINYTVSAPIVGEKGVLIGVVVLRYNPKGFFSIVTNENGLGDSEESFLINNNKYFLTPSRFLGESVILKNKVETENANSCFEKGEIEYVNKNGYSKLLDYKGDSAFLEAKDYRGVDIIGSHFFVPETRWCLIIKVDKSEIRKVDIQVGMILGIVVFGSIVIFLVISSLISRKIVEPLKKLHRGTEIIEKGNLDFRVGTMEKDEIGQLSRSFDKMTDAIRKSREDIDKKVEIQTKDIQDKSRQLEDQQKAIINILEDVEEEKAKAQKLAGDLEKYKLAVDNASDQIVITDTEGRVMYANNALTRITGFMPEEAIGKKAGNKELWGGLMEQSFYEKLWKTIKVEKKIFTGEIDNKRKDGVKYTALASIAPVLNDKREVLFFVGIERDVSREKEIDRMKTEFLSVASHQLRTPLGSMRWNLEMLQKGDFGKLTKDVDGVIAQVYESNKRMINLVNDLLNVSRIDQGRVADEPIESDINNIIQEAITEQKPVADKLKVNIKFTKGILPKVTIDPKRFREVIGNMISNSIKYNNKDGSVLLLTKLDGDKITITIKDTGIGIPQKDQEHLFDKFYRASNATNSDTEGSGLGLYVVRTYLQSWGGEISFESQEKKGTTFILSLPKKPKSHILDINLPKNK